VLKEEEKKKNFKSHTDCLEQV